MRTQKSREGYVFVDHRASPGLPADIARASGYDPNQCKEGKLFEAASLTCSHCKCSVVKNPLRTRDRAHCRKCDHYVCDMCGTAMLQPSYDHLPYEKLQELGANHFAKFGAPLGSPAKLLMP